MSRNREIVKSYVIGDSGSLVVVVPKEIRRKLGTSAGDYFSVSASESGKIIYRPIELEESK